MLSGLACILTCNIHQKEFIDASFGFRLRIDYLAYKTRFIHDVSCMQALCSKKDLALRTTDLIDPALCGGREQKVLSCIFRAGQAQVTDLTMKLDGGSVDGFGDKIDFELGHTSEPY